MSLVVFNGATGGLGRYMATALERSSHRAAVLQSRLGDAAGARREFELLQPLPDEMVTFIPLAGLVPVVTCEKEPERAFKTNVTDTVALVTSFLEWATRTNVPARVLYVSTGHVYAPKSNGERISETDPVLPRSVYARTKLQAEDALRALFSTHPNDLIVARVFGLVSPAQPAPYVLPSMLRRATEKNFANMGGLDCVRDYLDARDVDRLLAALCARDWSSLSLPENRVVNLASGEGTAIRELFVLALETVGLTWNEVEPKMTLSPPRPDDIAWMVADPTLLAKTLRAPLRSIPLRQTVQEAFAH